MSTAFYGLNIAKTGLFASQKGLEVVGNNISNVTTVGYTRQRLNLSSIPAPNGSGKLANVESATVGGGVNIDSIEQCRDQYLDIQYRNENSLLGEWTVKADALYYVEDLFNNSNETGIDNALNALFDSFEELSKSPENEEIRTLVRQNAIVFTETMNYYSNKLEGLQYQQNDAISVTVGDINTLTQSISDYNSQILKYERNGDNANELRDKRNTAIDELSNIVDITYSESPSGVVTVNFSTNKDCLVDENGAYSLSLNKNLPDSYGNADKFYSIMLSPTVSLSASDLNGGTLKGYLDERDGDTEANMGIPYFLKKLDALANAIVETVNNVHETGWIYPSESNAYLIGVGIKDGISFFDPTKTTAKDISLCEDILRSVFNIAASSVEITGDENKGNNKNVLEMLKVIDRTDIPIISNIGQYLKSIVADIAVQTSYSNKRVASENILVGNIAYKKESVSGVSIDEEMTNMIMFQKAYSAAARLITAIDEQLDTLVNKMGMVGR